jgi:hypothetical protein
MNLGKLLGAGKSIIGGGKPVAYRTDKRFYLPQFISPKNPFANPVTTATRADCPDTPEPVSAGPVKQRAVPTWAKTQKMVVPMPAATPAGSARAATWVSKFNPVSIFREATASPNKIATPVQVELSLEKVKVVHNDLTDADVEIVPMKSRPGRESTAETQPAKKTWADLGERIMKATAL